MSPRIPDGLRRAGREVRAFLLQTVWPEVAVCAACGVITDGFRLCPRCRESLQSEGTSFSWLPTDLEPDLRAYSMRPHEGVARRLILSLKHQAEAGLAEELASLLDPVPSYISFPPETVVTWVSMPESRRLERCIDHGKLLAEAVAARFSLPCRCLLVRRETRSRTQASLSRVRREKNLENAFEPAEPVSFPVLLVDDVLTTGTTARRCAETLRKAGADRITVLTFTRSVGNSLT